MRWLFEPSARDDLEQLLVSAGRCRDRAQTQRCRAAGTPASVRVSAQTTSGFVAAVVVAVGAAPAELRYGVVTAGEVRAVTTFELCRPMPSACRTSPPPARNAGSTDCVNANITC